MFRTPVTIVCLLLLSACASPNAGGPTAASSVTETPAQANAPSSAPAATSEGPITITKAREECWMKYEPGKRESSAELDKRLKLVETCVNQRMNASIGR
jgi:hypothetical protein